MCESPQHGVLGALDLMFVRLRPTLPHRSQCSTIGAEGLSFRVRNGTGRFPFAMTAETLWSYKQWVCSRPYLGNCTVDASCIFFYATKVGVVSSHRLISTSQLHALLHFHIWPINPVVYWEPLEP